MTKVQKAEYAAWCKSVGIKDDEKKQKVFKSVKIPSLIVPIERSSRHIPSLNPTDMGPATKPDRKVYTGNKIIGIGTLHKSNAVPVFSAEEAKDISSMRR